MMFGKIKVILENLNTISVLQYSGRHLISKTRYAVNLTHHSAARYLPARFAQCLLAHSLWKMQCLYKTPEDLWN